MFRMKRLILLSTFFLILIPAFAPAQFQRPSRTSESEFSGGLNIDFSSQYIWRGLEYNSKAVFQPDLWLNEGGFEIGARGNLDLTDSNRNKGKITEWNYRGGLAKQTRDAKISLTYNYYDYPEDDRSKTQEIALELGWGYPARLGLDLNWDFDRADGLYWKTYCGYIWEIGILKIIPEIGIGFATSHYQKYYFNVKKTGFLDFVASLALELKIVSGISLTAKGSYYELVTSELREAQKSRVKGKHFWGGGGLKFRF